MANITVDTQAIEDCQKAGMTQAATAEKLDISLSAVCYHWSKKTGRGRPKGRSSNTERIAFLISENKTDRQIAAELGIAISTVNRHRRSLLRSSAAKKVS